MVAYPGSICPRCGVLVIAHHWTARRGSRVGIRPCGLTVAQAFAVLSGAEASGSLGSVGSSMIGEA